MNRLARYSRRALLIGVASIGGGLAFGNVTTPDPSEDDGSTVTCPFLAMSPPDTTNMWSFASGCTENGMALFVTVQVTYQQKGLISVLRHEAPDIYRLREVHGVSHDDRYAPYQDELRNQAKDLAVDGRLTLQDLVVLKEWVANELNVVPNEASRIETALLFVRAGGDLETWSVGMEDVFRLVAGQRPSVDAIVTPNLLNQARGKSVWTM